MFPPEAQLTVEWLHRTSKISLYFHDYIVMCRPEIYFHYNATLIASIKYYSLMMLTKVITRCQHYFPHSSHVYARLYYQFGTQPAQSAEPYVQLVPGSKTIIDVYFAHTHTHIYIYVYIHIHTHIYIYIYYIQRGRGKIRGHFERNLSCLQTGIISPRDWPWKPRIS